MPYIQALISDSHLLCSNIPSSIAPLTSLWYDCKKASPKKGLICIPFLDPEKIPEFYDRVYKIVAQIPRGKVATYGQIAAIAGNPFAARAVGTAMRKAPEYLYLPCHRVVNQSGRLAPAHAFGGAGRQRALLEAEGIGFRENGSIDMKQYLWRPCY